MHLEPAHLEAAYELIKTTPPFKGWKLPPADEVEFAISRNGNHAADAQWMGTHWRIRVNGKWTGNLSTLLRYMMHEMVHVAHGIQCPSDSAHHGQEFKRLGRLVCRFHYIDPKTF